MVDRYKSLFQKKIHLNTKSLVPFFTIGDPSLTLSYKLIHFVLKNKLADALELGIPFSDPIADGPVIQKANLRAIKSGATLKKCFTIIKNIRNNFKKVPIGILVYANMVYQKGIKKFFFKCSEIEIDSVIVPDIPIEEHYYFKKMAKLYKIHYIYMCPPNSRKSLLKTISKIATGFVYIVSGSGVTGQTMNSKSNIKETISILKNNNSAPLLQGFGISNIKHIENAFKNGVTGVICGSVIVSIIEKLHKKNPSLMIKKIFSLLSRFKQSTSLKYHETYKSSLLL